MDVGFEFSPIHGCSFENWIKIFAQLLNECKKYLRPEFIRDILEMISSNITEIIWSRGTPPIETEKV